MMKKLLLLPVVGALLNPIMPCIAGGIDLEIENKDFAVYVPNLPASNEVTGGLFFLRPSGNTDYGVLVSPFSQVIPADISAVSPSWEVERIRPGFNAGFSIGLKHVFAESGNDFNLYWASLRTNNNSTLPELESGNPPDFQMSGPNWEIGPDADAIRAIRAQVAYHYDVVNGEVGKYVNLDPNLTTRLFTGVSGLWLKQQLTATYSGYNHEVPFVGDFSYRTRNESKFSGAGFRLGMENQYRACNNFDIVGMFAGNLFVGSQHPTMNMVGESAFLEGLGLDENYQSISHNSYIQLVPAFDAKLGIKYSYEFTGNGTLTVEAGYMGSIYINAIQNYVPSTYVPGPIGGTEGLNTGSVYLQSLIKTTDNFAVDGPYVNFSYRM